MTAAIRSSPAPVSTDGSGSGVSVPSAEPVILHEDEVPDLEKPAFLGEPLELRLRDCLCRARRPPCWPLQIDVDLRAGSAGPGVAHLPEVVLVAQAVDAVIREARISRQRARASSSL